MKRIAAAGFPHSRAPSEGRVIDLRARLVKTVAMNTVATELTLHRWPYGLELQPSANGLLLRPRRKARASWSKAFRHARAVVDDLAATRQLRNDFDAREWEW